MFANAGISGGMANIFDTDVALMTEVLRVNLIGPFLAIRHAAPRIAERGGGAIVLTASVAGLRSGAGSPAYSASKAGVINLAQVAAQQLAGSNVRVNALLPGLTETGMTQPVFDHARAAGKGDRIGRLNPLRRGGRPEELARVALFLASDDAAYVNGQALAADGGLSSSHPVVRQEYGQTAA
jgi:NAD(P)-dependent dehydrogenase (short-subunit alcohol dehydrogenase family)